MSPWLQISTENLSVGGKLAIKIFHSSGVRWVGSPSASRPGSVPVPSAATGATLSAATLLSVCSLDCSSGATLRVYSALRPAP